MWFEHAPLGMMEMISQLASHTEAAAVDDGFYGVTLSAALVALRDLLVESPGISDFVKRRA